MNQYFFLAGGIRPRIKAQTNNGIVEGKAVDVRDDLVLDTEKVKFIPLEGHNPFRSSKRGMAGVYKL